MKMKQEQSRSWFCPLFQNDIPEGRCLDINYERLGYINDNCLEEVTRLTGKVEREINKTCEACPNLPMKDSEIQIRFPHKEKS